MSREPHNELSENDRRQYFAQHVTRRGPDRIVVDENGHAVRPAIARRDYGRARIDVVFIRQDGWAVGAASDLEAVAEQLWPEHWIAVLRPPSTRAERYVPARERQASANV